jgi:hypothetical protein
MFFPPLPDADAINAIACQKALRDLAESKLWAEHYIWEVKKLEARLERLNTEAESARA